MYTAFLHIEPPGSVLFSLGILAISNLEHIQKMLGKYCTVYGPNKQYPQAFTWKTAVPL